MPVNFATRRSNLVAIIKATVMGDKNPNDAHN